MWNIRNSEKDRKEGGETEWGKIRKTNHERLLIQRNKLRVAEVEVGRGGDRVTG